MPDDTPDPIEINHRLHLLAEALGNVLVAAGMIREDVALTGPELLLAADTYCNPGVDAFAGQKLVAGDKVARDDGRFYVPVNRAEPVEGLSPTVLRIASDAFGTIENAEAFADGVVSAWNTARRIKT